ncbi:MAG: hypothetical protein GYB55_23485 [Cytophagales bacterium]|nr:hypothetical protein [Cytophagales bacterium]
MASAFKATHKVNIDSQIDQIVIEVGGRHTCSERILIAKPEKAYSGML